MASLAGLFGNNKGFNAANVEPSQDFQPMKAGTYKAIINSSSLEPAKTGSGTNLVLEFKIVEGEYKNRTLKQWLCVQHAKQETQEIAQRNFSAICHAVNQMQVTTTEQLHGKPMLVRIALEPDNRDPEKLQNRIKSYMPMLQSVKPEAAPAEADDIGSDVPW
jgi:hypothetical protein